MARITVEDCLPVVANRFELVMLAAQRARELARGAPSEDPEPHHAPTVAALRDIASGRVDPQEEREALIRSLMRHPPDDAEQVEDGMTDETGFVRRLERLSQDGRDGKDAA